MVINIVCTHHFRKKIELHPKYQMDLGRSYTTKSKTGLEIDIKDKFVLEYYSETREMIYKVGRLGPVSFYTSANMGDTYIIIYKDGVKHIRTIDLLELELNYEKYFTELLMSTEEESK